MRETDVVARGPVTITVPWSPGVTVNHMYRSAGGGKLVLSEDARRFRGELALLVRAVASHALEVQPGERVLVTLRVFVPGESCRMDCDNPLKLVFDGVKRGLDVDDQWFDLGGSRVRVDSQRPRLEVDLAVVETVRHHDNGAGCGDAAAAERADRPRLDRA